MTDALLKTEMSALLSAAASQKEQVAFERFLHTTLRLTRDQNPTTHVCVYFAAIDCDRKLVLVGHHKKSGLWLFNGGHVDMGESLTQTLHREMSEEWGSVAQSTEYRLSDRRLLTVTHVVPNVKQTCRTHYDVWHFLMVDSKHFLPDENAVAIEFFITKWLTLHEAREVVSDQATQQALDFIQTEFFTIDRRS